MGNQVSLNDFCGKKVVLYFYPKDDTPGCTKEACYFRDSVERLADMNAVVLGVSNDSIDSHVRFANKYKLNFRLLCDEDKSVSKTYGVYKLKNMYGRTIWGIERSTFIIDEKGIVKKVFRKVKVDQHLKEVVEALSARA
ncbi:MAG: thioredoxin-dependent thiol peroxidase [Candidatus Marsarchaeota archaeon]|nr:thioredoxin-dependent thiol peroxidase [Candidatus Marsarchaeota archaeon]